MPRITVYVDDDTAEWLDAENDRTGKSKAKLGGECIELIRSDVDHIEEARSDVMQTASISRLDEVEERLEGLEQRLEPSPKAHERDARTDPGQAAHGAVTDEPSGTEEQKQSDDAHSGSETPVDLDEVLLGVYDGMERRGARREAGLATLQWLRDRETAHSAGDVKDALFPEHRTNGESAKIWWRKNARPALQAAADAGLVEYRAGYNDYRWTG